MIPAFDFKAMLLKSKVKYGKDNDIEEFNKILKQNCEWYIIIQLLNNALL